MMRSKNERKSDIDHLPMLTESEAAYIAGFVDADGSIMIQRFNKKYFRLLVNVSNRDLEVLQWIHNKTGFMGFMDERKHDLKNKKWSRAYVLVLSIQIAEWLLRQIEPYMIVKRIQASWALYFCDLREKTRCGGIKGARLYSELFPQFAEIYFQMQRLNRPNRTPKKESGELQGSPNANGEGNLQPSLGKLRLVVPRKVQRLTDEDATPISPTRAPDPKGMK
jgi:hypothetical protein